MFQIHFPHAIKDAGGANDYRGRRCPFPGIPTPRFAGDHRCLCNIWSITHPGTVLACDGLRPPDVCPLAHSNDVVVHWQKDRIVVTP